jgi:50S ribosomal protein L16 3-hydroxylase
VDQPDSDQRYADPALALQNNPGEITPAALEALHAIISEKLMDRRAFARWFGEYATTPKNPEIDWAPEVAIDAAGLRALVSSPVSLIRNPASRFSFVSEGDEVVLFVDGESYVCPDASARFAKRLCAQDGGMLTPADMASAAIVAIVVALLNLGAVEIEDEDG